MLSGKPWKFEAILRLLLSVFVCHFFGTVVATAIPVITRGAGHRTWLFFGLAGACALCCTAALFILRKPWALDRFRRRFATLLVCVYVGLALGALAQHVANPAGVGSSTWRTLVAALSFQGVAILFIRRFVREHEMHWPEAFGFKIRWPLALLFGVLAAAIFLPVGWLLQSVTVEFLSRVHVKTEIQPAVQALQQTVTWLDRVVIGVVAIGIAPVGEELLFRGVIYPAIKQAGFPRLALWGTSFLFAAIHVNLGTFMPLFLLALVLTQLYERTGNLLAPIAAHVLFNALNFARFFYLADRLTPPG